MLPWLRWTLVITDLMLLASLCRRRSTPWLQLYILVAAYSAIDYHPMQPAWWVQHWIWAESVRLALRVVVTLELFRCQSRASMGEHRAVGYASLLVGISLCLLYRFSCGPGLLKSFMAVRTYLLLIIWSSWFVALLCWWRLRVPLLSQGLFWQGLMLTYTGSAVIDWNIDTKGGWNLNTNLWSFALAAICLLWTMENELHGNQDRVRYRPLNHYWGGLP